VVEFQSVRLPTLKTAPIWLPVAFLFRDIGAWEYVFSYEPGITEKAVRIHHFLLIPGTFFTVGWSLGLNLLFGLALGFGLREAALRRFPVIFPVLVLIWDGVLTGALWFLVVEDSERVGHLFRIGLMPGSYIAHLFAKSHIVTNQMCLLVMALASNLFLAIAATAAYVPIRRRWNPKSSSGPDGSANR